MSSSTKIDNRKKCILILGIGPTQRLQHTLTAENLYSINYTENNKIFCLSLHYNGANEYLFVNDTENVKLKKKEIVGAPLYLGNSSKDFSADNIKITGLNRCIYGFSVDYNATPVDDILDIHKYFMEKNDII